MVYYKSKMKKCAWAFSPSVTFPVTLDNVCLRCFRNKNYSAQGKHSYPTSFYSIIYGRNTFSSLDCTLSFIMTWRLSFHFHGSRIVYTIIQKRLSRYDFSEWKSLQTLFFLHVTFLKIEPYKRKNDNKTCFHCQCVNVRGVISIIEK